MKYKLEKAMFVFVHISRPLWANRDGRGASKGSFNLSGEGGRPGEWGGGRKRENNLSTLCWVFNFKFNFFCYNISIVRHDNICTWKPRPFLVVNDIKNLQSKSKRSYCVFAQIMFSSLKLKHNACMQLSQQLNACCTIN